MTTHEVVIIGAGPAGLAAGLYLARRGADLLLLEEAAPGGQLGWAGRIDNYPGFPGGIAGPELAGRFLAHFEQAGGRVTPGRVSALVREDDGFFRVTAGGEYRAGAVIVASGNRPVRLGLPGEEALTGRGVSYCAVCDGPFFRGRTVAVIGRGPRAAHEAAYLAGLAGRIYLLAPDGGRPPPAPPGGTAAIESLSGRPVTAIVGEGRVTALRLGDGPGGAAAELPVAGVFIFAGARPATDFLPPAVTLAPGGYVRVDGTTATALPGLFACGDCCEQPLRQVITACAGGAQAAWAARRAAAGRR